MTLLLIAVAGIWVGVPLGWFLCGMFSVGARNERHLRRIIADNARKQAAQTKGGEASFRRKYTTLVKIDGAA